MELNLQTHFVTKKNTFRAIDTMHKFHVTMLGVFTELIVIIDVGV